MFYSEHSFSSNSVPFLSYCQLLDRNSQTHKFLLLLINAQTNTCCYLSVFLLLIQDLCKLYPWCPLVKSFAFHEGKYAHCQQVYTILIVRKTCVLILLIYGCIVISLVFWIQWHWHTMAPILNATHSWLIVFTFSPQWMFHSRKYQVTFVYCVKLKKLHSHSSWMEESYLYRILVGNIKNL